MKTRESEEMYLETILIMKNKNGQVRSVDIVEELDYAKSSVSRAVNLLKKRGFITISDGNNIELTAEGREKAQYILKRHRILTKALTALGLNTDEAESNACRIEHVITDSAFSAIEKYLIAQKVDLSE